MKELLRTTKDGLPDVRPVAARTLFEATRAIHAYRGVVEELKHQTRELRAENCELRRRLGLHPTAHVEVSAL